jgi:antitoxin MazE
MKIAKWGGNLAIRIPTALVRELGLKEGDEITISSASKDHVELSSENNHQAALERIKSRRLKLPEGYKFDREEANSR